MSGRFLDPEVAEKWTGPPVTRPSFGFCGQLPGISKQVCFSDLCACDVTKAWSECVADKRALHFDKRDLHFDKRALNPDKRALHSPVT